MILVGPDGISEISTGTVDISSLLMSKDSSESPVPVPPSRRHHTRAASVPPTAQQQMPYATSKSNGAGSGIGTKRSMGAHPSESPAKKQSKWSAEEDVLIIDLRGSGMKWEDISKRLPGRSAISCRLHYQNYLERRSEWDEERKNKLARLYERFKPEMWSKVAEEMAVPWRAAEAMHWQLGEADMARRAGVVPFSLTTVNVDTQSNSSTQSNRPSPTRGQIYSQSGVSPTNSIGSTRYGHQRAPSQPPQQSRSIVARQDCTPRSVPPPGPIDGMALAGIGNHANAAGRGGMLPSLAEMTTGVSPYNTPAYAMSMTPVSGYPSPVALLPPVSYISGRPDSRASDHKRRGSPEMMSREASRRRY